MQNASGRPQITCPADRLILSFDLRSGMTESKVHDSQEARSDVLVEASKVRELKPTIAAGAALRSAGYTVLKILEDDVYYNMRAFADLALWGDVQTLQKDAFYLSHYKPSYVTVSCLVGHEAMKQFQASLPNTTVVAVPTLSDYTPIELRSLFVRGLIDVLAGFSARAMEAGVNSVTCPVTELIRLRQRFPRKDLSIFATGVEPKSVADAIRGGADYVIVDGRKLPEEESQMQSIVGRMIAEIGRTAAPPSN